MCVKIQLNHDFFLLHGELKTRTLIHTFSNIIFYEAVSGLELPWIKLNWSHCQNPKKNIHVPRLFIECVCIKLRCWVRASPYCNRGCQYHDYAVCIVWMQPQEVAILPPFSVSYVSCSLVHSDYKNVSLSFFCLKIWKSFQTWWGKK